MKPPLCWESMRLHFPGFVTCHRPLVWAPTVPECSSVAASPRCLTAETPCLTIFSLRSFYRTLLIAHWFTSLRMDLPKWGRCKWRMPSAQSFIGTQSRRWKKVLLLTHCGCQQIRCMFIFQRLIKELKNMLMINRMRLPQLKVNCAQWHHLVANPCLAKTYIVELYFWQIYMYKKTITDSLYLKLTNSLFPLHQLYKRMKSTCVDTLHGPCSTTLSGLTATASVSGCSMWILPTLNWAELFINQGRNMQRLFPNINLFWHFKCFN